MLAVSFKFSQSAPRVAGCAFLGGTHAAAFRAITGRDPSAFERATASALWQAYVRLDGLYAMRRESSPHATVTLASREHSADRDSSRDATVTLACGGVSASAFQAVSAATGSGKSVGTCALIAHLSPAPCAFVIQTVEECEKVYRALSKLLPGRVAVYTSLHKINASPSLIAEKERELGLVVTRRFTESEFKAAQVAITTHERWKREIDTGTDLGVRLCDGKPRELVIVDEDPSLERVYVKQPEDVSKLASVFADVTLQDEARSHGFIQTHYAADTLAAIHNRMRAIKDGANGIRLYSTDIVGAADVRVLESIQYRDIIARLQDVPPAQRGSLADEAWSTVEFLKAASQGRVFYSRDAGGAFYAYALQIPVQSRTLILDGTADINGMYAIGSHVAVAGGERPNYSAAELHLVNPSREFAGQMKPNKLLRNQWSAKPYMEWFFGFLLEHTREGEHVLIYAKDALLSYGIHLGDEFDESPPEFKRTIRTLYKGRHLHWCHFGRGRGSNDWKHCTAYFRLGDFHMKKAVLLARVGSATGKAFDKRELSSLSSGRSADPMLKLASDTHLIVANKQDAARTCIRHLSDDGKCAPARLYMIDCDKALLTKYRERMFPGSKEYRVIECDPNAKAKGKTRGASSVDRLADLLLSHAGVVLTSCDIGIPSKHIDRALSSPKVSPIVTARGWTKTTRRAVGLPGKGYVLSRAS